MKFTDICIITKNVAGLASFYETVFEAKAEGDNIHSFINVAGLGIAIYDMNAAITDMKFDLTDAGTGLISIGFDVDDVDMEYSRVNDLKVSCLTKPQLWPWGAKSFRFYDPDGNIITFRSWPK